MKIVLYVLLLTSLSVITVYACICPPRKTLNEARSDEILNSNIIFVGDIIHMSEDKRELTITIEEVFKGELNDGQVINGINNLTCHPSVENLGQWLIYGSLQNGEVQINECGLSRSLTEPYKNHFFMKILPPTEYSSTCNKYESDSLSKILKEESIEQSFVELEIELNLLRNIH